jgi:deoxyadenosine/deoxycytidine kinase
MGNRGNDNKPILVSIEGNIGSGKSTLLKSIKSRNPQWTYIDEPLDTWSSVKNENGESLLEVFYRDRKRWSYTFQNCVLFTRHQYIESTVNNAITSDSRVFITERCLDTDCQVFTKMLHADGNISQMEMDLYLKLFKQLKSTATPLSAIVHVDTDPALCAERIKLRSRSGESGITLDYLESLDRFQNRWIASEEVPKFVTDLKDISKVEDFIKSLEK